MRTFPDRLGERALAPDGMVRYLDAVLAEAAAALDGCAAAAAMPEPLRAAVRALERRTGELRAGMNRGDALLHATERERETLSGFTRSVLRDAERAGLFDAYRERCRTLAARLADRSMRDAALAELDAALHVLARSVGLLPERGGTNWIRKADIAARTRRDPETSGYVR